MNAKNKCKYMFEGQVRSECLTCTFRASCCSAHLSQAQVLTFVGSSVRDRGKKGGAGSIGGLLALAGTREYEQSNRKIELWSYVVSFEFSRPKRSSDRT